MLLDGISQAIDALASHHYYGRVTAILGMLLEIGAFKGICRSAGVAW